MRMNIKAVLRTVTGILPLYLFATLLFSCDNIAEEDRLIYEAPPTVNRSVLIEDFTGQRCVNCPNAADEIHSLQQEYGDSAVIAVGIHGGPMAVYPNPAKNVVGLATETGDRYNEYWKVEQWPMGMVNRHGVINYVNWKTQLREELAKVAPVNISGSFKADEGTAVADITVWVEGTQGRTTGKLQLWVVEDNIVATQLMPDGSANKDYVHQHVFRAAVNGEWGEDITVNEGETITRPYTLTFANDWVPANLSIVAFVYNDDGVLQVIRCPLQFGPFWVN